MRIVLLPAPEGDVIAREDQLGQLEAEFVVAADGQVLYRHPWDNRSWFAGRDVDIFRQAAMTWNSYSSGQAPTTDEQWTEAVTRLRQGLARLGVPESRTDNLWSVLLEQAEQGLL
jgi:hypothetical protein